VQEAGGSGDARSGSSGERSGEVERAVQEAGAAMQGGSGSGGARSGSGCERSGEVGAVVQEAGAAVQDRSEGGVERSGSGGERSEEVGAAVQEAGAAVREMEANFMRATTNLAPFLMGKAKRNMETSRKSRSAFACPLITIVHK
jgi:hypothetical protein